MDIRHYTLSLKVDISKESITGFTDVDVILAKTADTLLLDLINLYEVSSIAVNIK
jgi:pterin-4a-carbinolamine dehydratase